MYHAVNEGYCSRADWARSILRLTGSRSTVRPVNTPWVAKMPQNGRLSTASLGESWALMAGGGGKWELEFTLPAESTAEDFAPALAFRLGEVEAVLETVRVSPLEVWMECFSAEGAFCMLNPAREDYDPEWANANRPCLVLADGTVLYADGSGGGSGEGSYWYSGFRAAEKPVAPEDITGLRVGETVYPLCLR